MHVTKSPIEDFNVAQEEDSATEKWEIEGRREDIVAPLSINLEEILQSQRLIWQ